MENDDGYVSMLWSPNPKKTKSIQQHYFLYLVVFWIVFCSHFTAFLSLNSVLTLNSDWVTLYLILEEFLYICSKLTCWAKSSTIIRQMESWFWSSVKRMMYTEMKWQSIWWAASCARCITTNPTNQASASCVSVVTELPLSRGGGDSEVGGGRGKMRREARSLGKKRGRERGGGR